jgi:uncharacterized protein YndB with AHSA1/START domain
MHHTQLSAAPKLTIRRTFAAPRARVFAAWSDIDVLAPERLAFTFRWEEDDPAQELDTFITVELIDKGSETEMIFSQEGFRDETSRDKHIGGWTMGFDNIDRMLAT